MRKSARGLQNQDQEGKKQDEQVRLPTLFLAVLDLFQERPGKPVQRPARNGVQQRECSEKGENVQPKHAEPVEYASYKGRAELCRRTSVDKKSDRSNQRQKAQCNKYRSALNACLEFHATTLVQYCAIEEGLRVLFQISILCHPAQA